MAASKVRSDDINFMAQYGRGLICLTLTRARCEQLRLPLMVSQTDERQTTNFTHPVTYTFPANSTSQTWPLPPGQKGFYQLYFAP